MLLGVDVGGTYTDAALVGEDGSVWTAKVPTTPGEQSVGVLAAIEAVLARADARPQEVERFAHGMTVATNALLEGRTARTALIATAGFTDVIELGRQARPHLYRLCQAAPAPLVAAKLRFGAPERMGPEGPLAPLAEPAARALAEDVAACAPEAVAVALLHSYADPAHERALAVELARALPGVHVSLSAELVGTFREYERTATTALDAALSPLLSAYLERLACESREIGLPEPQIMQSSGGLTEAAHAAGHAALTVLSGPAGGVGGALLAARRAGEPRVLCFDMGGTSCDVCLIDEEGVPETAERTIAGRPLALPALDIHTVGAGGGSIAWRDEGGALRVGPASAGAVPGPACYGLGGSLPTVTDANLLLGRLPRERALAGDMHLDGSAAERAVGELAREIGLETLACAEGILAVAENEMLGALRLMTVERGIDPRGFALMPFGGAGPLHAAALARELGIAHVLCPRACGVLCALGLAAAAPRRDAARTLMLSEEQLGAQRLTAAREELVAIAAAALGTETARARVRSELRYRGQSFELAVEEELPADPRERSPIDPARLREDFAAAHERRYGYRDEDAPVELVTMRASVWGSAPAPGNHEAGAARAPEDRAPAPRACGEAAQESREIVFAGSHLPARVLRGEPAAGTELRGPALFELPESTLLVPPAWQARVDEQGTVHLHDTGAGG